MGDIQRTKLRTRKAKKKENIGKEEHMKFIGSKEEPFKRWYYKYN